MTLGEKYVYKIYEEKSFSAAARALYISQPALSAMLAKQEKKLNFRIFDRSTNPVSLTPMGRIYMEHLREVMESENNMELRIRQLSDSVNSALSIGGSNQAAYALFPFLCKEFYRRHPEIAVTLDMGAGHARWNLLDRAKSKGLDLVLVYNCQDKMLKTFPLKGDRLVIAMSKNMPGAQELIPFSVTREELLDETYAPEKELSDFSMFRDIKFFEYVPLSTTERLMHELFGDEVKPAQYQIRNAKNLIVDYSLMEQGLGATLVSDIHYAMQADGLEDEILYFVPKTKASYRNLCLATHPDHAENPAVQKFVALAQELCKDLKSRWREYPLG